MTTKYATIDPTTGEVVREFATISDDEAAQALQQSHTAHLSWRDTDIAERAAVLARTAELYREHATELAQLMTLEMGKPIAQAKGEVELSAQHLRVLRRDWTATAGR